MNLHDELSPLVEKQMAELAKKGANLTGGAQYNRVFELVYKLLQDKAALQTHADKMAEALREINNLCDSVNFSSHNQMREAIEGTTEASETALTDYENFKKK